MKRYAYALVLMLAAVYVAAEVPTNGLIAAYTFNGKNPWRDVSGHGHDLKVVDPAFPPDTITDLVDMNGNRHRVVYYKPNDRRISALSATINNLPKGEESRTILFYLKIQTSLKGYDGTILSYGTTQNVLHIIDTIITPVSIDDKWGLFSPTFAYYLKGYPSTSFSNYTTQKDYVIACGGIGGAWTFIVFTYNYITGTSNIRIGGMSGSKSLTCPTPEAIGPLLIGGASRGFTGYIDDIYIYNRVLTSNEKEIISIWDGTLDIPATVTGTKTSIHPIQMKPIINQTVYTISGRKAQQTKGVTVSKGIAKVLTH